ncbi:hypothetical protein [Desulfosarcina sp. BuS5]|nr:hypothetical protein [Desulfosarcina sp. BuS5]
MNLKRFFGGLKVGKNPTKLRNSYYILKFDFSCVDPTGSAVFLPSTGDIQLAIKNFPAQHGGYERFNLHDELYRSIINF